MGKHESTKKYFHYNTKDRISINKIALELRYD